MAHVRAGTLLPPHLAHTIHRNSIPREPPTASKRVGACQAEPTVRQHLLGPCGRGHESCCLHMYAPIGPHIRLSVTVCRVFFSGLGSVSSLVLLSFFRFGGGLLLIFCALRLVTNKQNIQKTRVVASVCVSLLAFGKLGPTYRRSAGVNLLRELIKIAKPEETGLS